ncbi:MAG: hypothetical protein HQK83_09820 [Fibrobacteria bacterium]|nr:hypothetical protein [Fibrobacteria bacterium]
MKNKLLQEIFDSFEVGQLDDYKKSMLPFLLANKDKIHDFIRSFEEQNGKQSLETLIKFFILTYNMPFDMKGYLDGQSRAIEQDIGPQIDKFEERNKLVSKWIKTKAANYRSHTILIQIACFDLMKKEILPVIGKILDFCERQNPS